MFQSFGLGVPLLLNFYHLAVALLPLYPFMWAAVVIGVKFWFHNLPVNQQAMLEKNAEKVVKAVEQSGSGLSGADKKARAMSMLQTVCSATHVGFNADLADVAIEAVVFGFNQLKDAVEKNQPTVAPVQ
jgi:hypothetical protein